MVPAQPPGADDPSEVTTEGMGRRIRAIRHAQGLSIRDLADRANISTGMISQVERGINDPSLQTARAIAKALHTPLFDLFQEPDSAEVAVVRADRRMAMQSPLGGLTYQRISPGSGALEMLEGRLKPYGVSSEAAWSHPSEECAVSLEGTLSVEVDGHVEQLAPGDSCYFNSRSPHRYLNQTGEPVRFLVAITPPSY